MNNTEIKKRVKEFRKEFAVREVTVNVLEAVFSCQGFTIIEYNPVMNDEDVNTVVKNLGLEEMISHTNGFLYADANYRLVFISEKLSMAERLLVLSHEEGHYYCGHTKNKSIVGHTVTEEYEANEFTHFLLRKSIRKEIIGFASRHRKSLIISTVIAGLAAGGGIASKEYQEKQLYEGEYYVTMHGEKYHLEGCVTIEGHETRRLTKEDVESGKYKPCSVCQPDKSNK